MLFSFLMKVKIDLNVSLEENASRYYEAAKKAKKKIQGVNKTLDSFRKKQDDSLAKAKEAPSRIKKLKLNQGYWFEKFKWFLTSEGFLVVGGRDATTNEILIKKHTLKEDIVFHTEMAGSPFVIIKKQSAEDVGNVLGREITQPKEIGEASLQEAAAFTLSHSKAWKLGLGGAEVFYVSPDQISKEANSGEYISKGSFMVRGKRNFVQTEFAFGLGISKKSEDETSKNVLLSGPITALETYCDAIIQIDPGRDKASGVAKLVQSFFRKKMERDVHVDDVIKLLPSGGCQVKKARKTKAELGL